MFVTNSISYANFDLIVVTWIHLVQRRYIFLLHRELSLVTNETKYSRMDQVKFLEDGL